MKDIFNMSTFDEYKKYLAKRRKSNSIIRKLYEELEDDDSKFVDIPQIDIIIDEINSSIEFIYNET